MTAPARAVITSESDSAERIRGVELVLGGLMAVDMALIGPFPFAMLAASVLAVLGFLRRPRYRFGNMAWVPVTLFASLAYVAIVSMTSDHGVHAADWRTRLLRLAALIVVTMFLATGRLHLPSVVWGMALGLLVNVPLFYAGLVPDTYGGLLTGYAGDKNQAGMYYAAVGVLTLAYAHRRWLQALVVIACGVTVWLTASRTAISAYVLALLWIWLIGKRPALVRWAAAAAFYVILTILESDYARIGPFEERLGSDILRGRIADGVAAKLAQTPWWGQGLGEAYVTLDAYTWFFHDSFATLLVEGGWPYLIAVLAVTVVVCFRPLLPGRLVTREALIAQGAGVVLLITATKLGEVFLTIPWGLVVAAGLHAALSSADGPSPARLAEDR